MSPEALDFTLLYLALPLLALMALEDLSRLRISNRLVLAMVVLACLSAPVFLPWAEIGHRLIAALSVFVLGFSGFALRLWGGGDVKALAALMLFLPSQALTLYAWTFVAGMALGLVAVMGFRAVLRNPDIGWSGLQPNAGYPMGLSIALSGALLPLAAMQIL
ncbi:A24 family peptidase [Aestuariivita boseongensis]|uniref:A24 family peptidase n=1 Tax=Aestuariivita boseongensis TaxID=1470562 RepID=UPI0006809C1D|nr:prepilin peptidase [Aestuariivita boseongensis]